MGQWVGHGSLNQLVVTERYLAAETVTNGGKVALEGAGSYRQALNTLPMYLKTFVL